MTMKSRRKFIKTIAVGMIGGHIASYLPTTALAAAKDISKDGFEIQKGYVVFNETTQKNMLKLAVVLFPGSDEIGIQEKIMNLVRNDHGVAGFLDAGLWNIDAISRNKYKKPFYLLENKDHIDAILRHISVRNRLFFNNFRNIVIKMYYSDPSIWQKLSYDGPPQPKGFMDYTDDPKQMVPSKKQSK
jgi:hypothetical protein